MDREQLEAVLGRTAAHLKFTPGWLMGYAAERAARYTFPTLVERLAGRVDGIVTIGLSNADVARIACFEDVEYAPIVAAISTAEGETTARLNVATARLRSSGEPWHFEHWRKHDKPLLLAITRKVMREHYGISPLTEIDGVWHRIKRELETGPQATTPTPATARGTRRAVSSSQRPRRA